MWDKICFLLGFANRLATLPSQMSRGFSRAVSAAAHGWRASCPLARASQAGGSVFCHAPICSCRASRKPRHPWAIVHRISTFTPECQCLARNSSHMVSVRERASINGIDHNTMQVIADENILWTRWIEQLFEGRDILGRKPLLMPWMMMMKVVAQPGL
jgi:hypothetical protein